MTNDHWLQLAIAMMTPLLTLMIVMVGFLYNNSRFNDLRQDLKDLLRAEVGRLEAEIRRAEEMLLSKFAELGNRLTRIEARLDLR